MGYTDAMIAEELKVAIAKAADIKVEDIQLEHPADLSHGDYSTNVAMTLAKEKGVSPQGLSEQILRYIEVNRPKGVEKIEVAGFGFINFYLSRDFFTASVSDALSQGEKWGKSTVRKGEKWLIEHTSPNPNKAMHIGHLRNNVTGMAISNIAEAIGVDVVRDAIDNNRGIAVAKLMWGYLKFAKKDKKEITDIAYWYEHQDEWDTPTTKNMRPDRFVDELYVEGSGDFDSDSEVQKNVRQLVVNWENEGKKNWALWQKVLEYSYEGQNMTLERLESHWDKVWHEHEHYKKGKELVEEGLEKGVFHRLEDGAVLTDLKQYNLPDTILLKSDGTSLYITQDIALTKLKRETFSPDRLFWVVGPDQSLALKQLFAVCEQLGIGKVGDYTHIFFGYMSIKGRGKMSSRKGNVLFIDDLLDEVKERVKNLMSDRDLDSRELEEIAETVSLGAIKYGILKTGRKQNTSFDIEQATNLQGDSGPYLQYSYARAQSVLAKGDAVEPSTAHPSIAVVELERLLYRFPEVVLRAAKEYEPHYVTTFLTELAGVFNSWYAKEKILDDGAYAPYKLALTKAFSTTMQNGLWLLGIKAPERM